MGLGCEWRHARKRWAENLVILKKQLRFDSGPGQSSWWVDCERCRRQLVCLPQWQTFEVEVWPSSPVGGYEMHSAFVGSDNSVSVIKIVALSRRVEKLKSEKLINVSHLNNGVSSVFLISLQLYICVVVSWLCAPGFDWDEQNWWQIAVVLCLTIFEIKQQSLLLFSSNLFSFSFHIIAGKVFTFCSISSYEGKWPTQITYIILPF